MKTARQVSDSFKSSLTALKKASTSIQRLQTTIEAIKRKSERDKLEIAHLTRENKILRQRAKIPQAQDYSLYQFRDLGMSPEELLKADDINQILPIPDHLSFMERNIITRIRGRTRTRDNPTLIEFLHHADPNLTLKEVLQESRKRLTRPGYNGLGKLSIDILLESFAYHKIDRSIIEPLWRELFGSRDRTST